MRCGWVVALSWDVAGDRELGARPYTSLWGGRGIGRLRQEGGVFLLVEKLERENHKLDTSEVEEVEAGKASRNPRPEMVSSMRKMKMAHGLNI